MAEVAIDFTGKDEVSKVMKGIGGNFAKLGSGIGKVAGGVALGGVAALGAGVAALGVGIAASVKEGASFSKQMSNVGAVSGATEQQMVALEKAAKDLGATTAFSGIEAAEGMQFLAQAGFEVEDIMSAMPGVLDLAAASGAELGRSADIVSNIISGFGADAKQTGKFVDILTKTFTTSNVNLDQLGESMKFAAPTAKSLGQTVEVTAASLGILGNAGLQGATAGEKFRSILSRLAGPTEKAQEVMDELGISVFDASGTMKPFPDILGQIKRATASMTQEQRNAALATLFSMENAGAFSILLDEGQTKIEDYAKTLGNSVGVASEVAAKQLDNLSGDVTLFQSAVSGVKLQVFEALEPILRSIVQTATRFIPFIGQAFDNLKPAIETAAGWMVNFVETIRKIGIFLIDATATGNVFNVFLNNIPESIQPVIQSIAKMIIFVKDNLPLAMATASEIFYNTLIPAFNSAVQFIGSAVLPIFMNMFNFIKDRIPDAIAIGAAYFENVLKPAFKVATDFIVGTLIPKLNEVSDWLSKKVPEFVAIAKEKFELFKTDILPAIIAFAESAIGKFKEFRDKAVQWFQEFSEKAKPIIDEFVVKFQEAWEQAGPVVTDALMRIGQAIGEMSKAFGVADEETNSVNESVNLLQQVLDGLVLGVKAVAIGINLLAQGFEYVAKAIQIAKGLADQFGQIISRVGDRIPDILKPGSPPPLAVAMSDIADSTEVATKRFAKFSAGFSSFESQIGAVDKAVNDFEERHSFAKAAIEAKSFGIDLGNERALEMLAKKRQQGALRSELGGQAEAGLQSEIERRLAPFRQKIEQDLRETMSKEVNPVLAQLNKEADKFSSDLFTKSLDLKEAKMFASNLRTSGKSLVEQQQELSNFLSAKGLTFFEFIDPEGTQKEIQDRLEALRKKAFDIGSGIGSDQTSSIIDSAIGKLASTDVLQDSGQGGNTTNNQNLNLTINTSAPSENIAADFQMMQAMAAPVSP